MSTLPPDPSLAGTPTTTPPSPNGQSMTGSGLSTDPPGPTLSGTPLDPESSALPPFTIPTGQNESGGSLPGETGGIDAGPPAVETEAEPTPAGGASQAAAEDAGLGRVPYYPMMPPMGPGAGRQGADVRPGDADGAGGQAIRWRGRDSSRAGLVPALQGRGGARDDDLDDEPMAFPAGDEVLDEELWQVSEAASPVTPPDSAPRRGRSRGF